MYEVVAWPAAVAFWTSIAVIAYAYVGYPILVALFARVFGRDDRAVETPDAQLPFVSVLIAAYNERAVIGERLENLLAIDYPADRLEIVVASDGSDDGTCEIVGRCTDPRVRLLDYRERRGKAAVLNSALAELRGDVVLMSDANTFTDPAAVRKLLRWFGDPTIGIVVGRLVLTDPATGRNADSLYWKYETFLKQCESRLGALLGANGAIYAIRRSMFTGIRSNTAVDDFVIPLLARIRTGCRLVYDAEAIANEETPAHVGAEFKRRSRIGAGGYQSLAVLHPLLHPHRGWIAFTFWSHKILRWTCPFFMLGALASSTVLASNGPVYAAALVLQIAGYCAAALGHFVPGNRGVGIRIVRLTTMFASMNLALLVGFWMWAAGRQGGIWQRTAR